MLAPPGYPKIVKPFTGIIFTICNKFLGYNERS